jgi:hypothetical protein
MSVYTAVHPVKFRVAQKILDLSDEVCGVWGECFLSIFRPNGMCDLIWCLEHRGSPEKRRENGDIGV